MAGLPGFKITVTRNGSSVRVKSGSVTREVGKLAPSWEITLAEPMDISKSDTWTIKRKLAGREETLINEAYATSIGGSDGVKSSSRRVSGEYGDAGSNSLLEYCVPKTLVFVRMDWITSIIPDAIIQNGMLVYGSVYSSGVRIFHPRLPGKEIQEGEFECIAGHNSHHACAQYLAGLVGYNLQVNTPDIDLVDTYTVPAGTTWREAIEKNFKIWFAVTDVGEDTITISDICSDEPAPIQVINLTNAAIENASLNRKNQSRTETPLDHLIITGRTTENTEELLDQDPDFTAITLAAIDLNVDTTITTSRDFTTAHQHKTMGEYTGNFGGPDEEEAVKALKSQSHEIGYHIDETEGRKRYIPITETIHTYDADDTEVAKTVITYTYAKGFKPIRTVEDEYIYTNMPGSDVKALEKLRSKVTTQDQFIKPLNLTLTTEFVEGVVLYEVVTVDAQDYKVDPQIMSDALRGDTSHDLIDTDPDTKQDTLEMTLNDRSTLISRTHDYILIKRDEDYNYLSKHTKTQSQILENPMRDPKEIRSKDQFRKEYHPVGSGVAINGMTCYHAPKTIHHDDITTEAIADQIAERAFIRKYLDQNDEWTVDVALPILPQSVAAVVRLPDYPVRVNGTLVTISGGDYQLTQAREDFAFDDNGKAAGTTALTVRERY